MTDLTSISKIELLKKRWRRYETNVTRRETIINILNDWKKDKIETIGVLEEINQLILNCKSSNIKGDRVFTLKEYFMFRQLQRKINNDK